MSYAAYIRKIHAKPRKQAADWYRQWRREGPVGRLIAARTYRGAKTLSAALNYGLMHSGSPESGLASLIKDH